LGEVFLYRIEFIAEDLTEMMERGYLLIREL
jgi:hypothetical protein